MIHLALITPLLLLLATAAWSYHLRTRRTVEPIRWTRHASTVRILRTDQDLQVAIERAIACERATARLASARATRYRKLLPSRGATPPVVSPAAPAAVASAAPSAAPSALARRLPKPSVDDRSRQPLVQAADDRREHGPAAVTDLIA